MDDTSGASAFTSQKKTNNSSFKVNDKSDGRLTWPYKATSKQYALHGLSN